VLAGRDRALEQRNPHLGGARIEENTVSRIGQGCVEVRRVARDIVEPGDLRELLGIAADQDGIGPPEERIAAMERTRCWL
jgi:hypothetical protein